MSEMKKIYIVLLYEMKKMFAALLPSFPRTEKQSLTQNLRYNLVNVILSTIL